MSDNQAHKNHCFDNQEQLEHLRQELPDIKPVESLLDELLSKESSEQSSVKQEATNALALW